MNLFNALSQYSETTIQLLEEENIGLKTIRGWIEKDSDNLESLIIEGHKIGEIKLFVNTFLKTNLTNKQIQKIRRQIPKKNKETLIENINKIINSTSLNYVTQTYLPSISTYLENKFTSNIDKGRERSKLHEQIVKFSEKYKKTEFKKIVKYITITKSDIIFINYMQEMNFDEAVKTTELFEQFEIPTEYKTGKYKIIEEGLELYKKFKDKKTYLKTVDILGRILKKKKKPQRIEQLTRFSDIFVQNMGLKEFVKYAFEFLNTNKNFSYEFVEKQVELSKYLPRKLLLELPLTEEISTKQVLEKYKYGENHLKQYLHIVTTELYHYLFDEIYKQAKREKKQIELVKLIAKYNNRTTAKIISRGMSKQLRGELRIKDLIMEIELSNKIIPPESSHQYYYSKTIQQFISKKGRKKFAFTKSITTITERKVARTFFENINNNYKKYSTKTVNQLSSIINEITNEFKIHEFINQNGNLEKRLPYLEENLEFFRLNFEKGYTYFYMTTNTVKRKLNNEEIHKTITPFLLKSNLTSEEVGALYIVSSEIAKKINPHISCVIAETIEEIAKYSKSLAEYLIYNEEFTHQIPKEKLESTYGTIKYIAKTNWRYAGAYVDLVNQKNIKEFNEFQSKLEFYIENNFNVIKLLKEEKLNKEWFSKMKPKHNTGLIREILYNPIVHF